MDLDPVGKHCALQSCNELDFLPIQCSCLKTFCRFHISPDDHDCVSLQKPQTPLQSGTRAKCALAGCSKLSLDSAVRADQPSEGDRATPASCLGCRLSFCVDHRHQQSHSCTGLNQGKDEIKHEAARAILAQNFSSTSTSSHTPVVARRAKKAPTDPKKLAQLQKVNLMKMRHKAIPGDPKDRGSTLSVDLRLHVNVRSELTGKSSKEIVFWFRKSMVTGKALDLAAGHFSPPSSSSLYLQKQSSEEDELRISLRNDLLLSEQIEDASTIILSDVQANT
ncbi:hypothetical protein HYDPIDRAFT_106183 [Hydnomerulius pinastri MD-312]|nr:hypothetical protein HYDPIDRAFT_106183 [Hydnomerulius pinastri MD-312]